MTKKYKVTQEFMDALIGWRDTQGINPTIANNNSYVSQSNIGDLPNKVTDWWVWGSSNPFENNRRLIAILQWLNGEDVFEIEKPHNFAVRSVKADIQGDYWWMYLQNSNYGLEIPVYSTVIFAKAKQFDTRAEAELWTTNGYEVVEIDEYGNEVTN